MDNIAKFIDHTLLKKDATKKDIETICKEAIKHKFYGVCVYPEFLQLAKKELSDKNIALITVIDFPMGEKTPHEKALEAKKAIEDGATELDMVLDVLALKDQDYKKVFEGIKQVVDSAKNIPVKVIIETCYLNNAEKIIASSLAKAAGAKFVKTSTGFAKEGANIGDVALMKHVVGEDVGIKASGGIKTLEDATMMIDAGATRLGTSSSLNIIQALKS